ncbi:MAG TPA: glycoside hydrolase family 3 N-terminal domain-containing protein [Bacilli bacterium]
MPKTILYGAMAGIIIVLLALGSYLYVKKMSENAQNPPAKATPTTPAATSPTPSAPAPKTPEPDPIAAIMSALTLQQKIGQMIMPAAVTANGALAPSFAADLAKYGYGGVILFRDDMPDLPKTVALTDAIGKAAGALPPFIATDQEGGSVYRLTFGTSLPGNMALGAAHSRSGAYAAGSLIGEELSALGINTDFAPVLDVNNNPDNPVIGVRSFGADPQLVAKLGSAEIQGLHASGVIAAAKHFPGHGDTDVDSHLGLPVIPYDKSRLEKIELIPFKSAIAHGVDMIMAAHITFPALEQTTVVSRLDGSRITPPASLSHAVLTDLLRHELGYEGVIVTDSLQMKAVTDHFGSEQAAVMAVQAGADLLLMPQNPGDLVARLMQEVKSGAIPESRIDESVRRILTLKEKYGLFATAGRQTPLTEKIAQAQAKVASQAHRQTAQKLAENGVTLVKNERNTLPFTVQDNARLLILAPDNGTLQTMRRTVAQLLPDGHVRIDAFSYAGLAQMTPDMRQAAARSDYVLMATSNLTKAGKSGRFAADVVSGMRAQANRLAVMALDSPYDLAYIPNAPAYLAIYGSVANVNLDAGLRAVFGKYNPTGKLPVFIPDRLHGGNLYEIGAGLSY